MDYKSICNKVCRLCEEVGEWIMSRAENFDPNCIENKGVQNLVSFVDRGAEDMLKDGLLRMVENCSFLGEEGEEIKGEGEYCWVVDPLDGTANFVHKLSPFCISVALMHKENVVVGVVYELTKKEMFCACENVEGCFLNGNKVTVSDLSDIKGAMVLSGVAYSSDGSDVDAFCKTFKHFNKLVNGVRRTGSAAANLAFVAAGRAELFLQKGLSPWDVAAGTYLVEKAGGIVIDYKGERNYIFGASVIATNRNTQKQFYKEICENLF